MVATDQLRSDLSPVSGYGGESVERAAMSIEAVMASLVVRPKPDAGKSGHGGRREKTDQQHRQKEHDVEEVSPQLNACGHLIGQTINITA
jgi:hypothetical protein